MQKNALSAQHMIYQGLKKMSEHHWNRNSSACSSDCLNSEIPFSCLVDFLNSEIQAHV